MSQALATLLSTVLACAPTPSCEIEHVDADCALNQNQEVVDTADVLDTAIQKMQIPRGGPQTNLPRQRKVAVLVASESPNSDIEEFRMAYWYDTVLVYCALRSRGFDDDEIYVIYGDGTDGAPASGAGVPDYYSFPEYCLDASLNRQITDYPMNVPVDLNDRAVPACDVYGGEWRCAPKAIFDCLASGCSDPQKRFFCPSCSNRAIPELHQDDFLLVWWRGHGSAGTNPPATVALNIGLDWISGKDLRSWIRGVKARRRVLVFETCESGCLTGFFFDPRDQQVSENATAFVTSCDCGEESEVLNTHDVKHAVFSFWFAGTVHGVLPPNSENPPNPPTPESPAFALRHTSLLSAFETSVDATHQEVGSVGGEPIQNPLMSDPSGLAKILWPKTP